MSFNKVLSSIATGAALLVAVPVLAQTDINVNATAEVTTNGPGRVKVEQIQIKNGKFLPETNKSDRVVKAETGSTTASSTLAKLDRKRGQVIKEIDRRIEGLMKLKTRIAEMKKLGATARVLIAQVDAEIARLKELKAKIIASKDADMAKAEIKASIDTHSIYGILVPQIEILASADRILGTVESLTTLRGKLVQLVAEARTAGKDVATLESALSVLVSKVEDAKVQAEAAISITSSVTASTTNTTATSTDAKKKALIEARSKIKAAHKSILDAQKSADKIVKALRAWNLTGTASTTLKVRGDAKVKVDVE